MNSQVVRKEKCVFYNYRKETCKYKRILFAIVKATKCPIRSLHAERSEDAVSTMWDEKIGQGS